MDKLKKHEALVTLAVLSGIAFIIMFAPLVYKFTYPSAGDDGAQYLFLLRDGEPVRNFGVYFISPFLAMGLSELQALSLLFYLIILASTVTVWFTARQYGLTTAIVATPLVILGNWGVWRLWFDGSVLSIGGLLIFTFGTFLCISRYKESDNDLWLVLMYLLAIMGCLFHKTMGIYLISTVLVYSILKREVTIGVITATLAGMGLLVWFNDNDMINRTLIELPWYSWIFTALWAVSLVYVWYLYRSQFRKFSTLTQLFIVLTGILFAGAVIKNPYQYRIVLDMLTVGLFMVAVLMAGSLKYFPEKVRVIALALMVIFPLTSIQERWMGNYTAIRTEDVEVIRYINHLADQRGTLTLATSYGESPWILRLYLNENVEVTTDIDKADLIVTMKARRLYNESHGAFTGYHLEIHYSRWNRINQNIYGRY